MVTIILLILALLFGHSPQSNQAAPVTLSVCLNPNLAFDANKPYYEFTIKTPKGTTITQPITATHTEFMAQYYFESQFKEHYVGQPEFTFITPVSEFDSSGQYTLTIIAVNSDKKSESYTLSFNDNTPQCSPNK